MYVIMLRTRYNHELRYTKYRTGGDKLNRLVTNMKCHAASANYNHFNF